MLQLLCRDLAGPDDLVRFDDAAIRLMIGGYTRESGLRRLGQTVGFNPRIGP